MLASSLKKTPPAAGHLRFSAHTVWAQITLFRTMPDGSPGLQRPRIRPQLAHSLTDAERPDAGTKKAKDLGVAWIF